MYNNVCNAELIFGNSASTTVIACGWADRRQLIARLTRDEHADAYCAIGNLYSIKPGISYLLRNLLANASIAKLICCEFSQLDRNAGPIKALANWWQNGEDLAKLELDAELLAFSNELNQLRQKCKLAVCYSYAELIAELKSEAKMPIGRNKIAVPMPSYSLATEQKLMPGQLVSAKDALTCWAKGCQLVLNYGESFQLANGIDGLQLIGLSFAMPMLEPSLIIAEKYCPIGFAEHDAYWPSLLPSKDEAIGSYSYGNRLYAGNLAKAIAKLKADSFSRQAYCSLWLPTDCELDAPPCMVSLQLQLSNNRLTLIANFRSHDLASAWLKNVFAISQLAYSYILPKLSLASSNALHQLVVHSSNAHIYSHSIGTIQKWLKLNANSYKYSSRGANWQVRKIGGAIELTNLATGIAIKPIGNSLAELMAEAKSYVLKIEPDIESSHLAYVLLEIAKLA